MEREGSTGLGLTLGGLGAFVGTVVLTAVSPEGARTWVFLAGITAVSGLCLVGGIRGRQALLSGDGSRVRAVISSMVGLVIGLTAGIFVFWNLVALVS